MTPISKQAMIDGQIKAGMLELSIRNAAASDDAAKQKLLERLRFEETQDTMKRLGLRSNAAADLADKLRKEERHEQLAVNVDRHNRLKSHDETMRRMVRFNSQELRELEFKLRTATVGQELRAQLHEREALRLQDKIHDQQRLQIMLDQVKRDQELDRQAKQAAYDKRLALRAALQDQMALKAMQHHQLYEEFLREKKTIDDIIQQIYDEKVSGLREKDMAKKRYRDDLRQFSQLQEALRQQEKRDLEEEDKRIAAFLVERHAKEDKRKQDDNDRKGRSAQLAERIGEKLLEEEQQRVERIELLHILRGEELEQIAAQNDRVELERKVRQRLDAVIQLHQQRAERLERVRQEQEDDREFRRREMETLAARDKIEQLSNERRRQKIIEHNRTVQQLLASKRNQNAEALMVKLEERREQEREEAHLKQIVEEERIKILQEHAVKFGGVFPRGVLRESDRKQLKL